MTSKCKEQTDCLVYRPMAVNIIVLKICHLGVGAVAYWHGMEYLCCKSYCTRWQQLNWIQSPT